MQSIHTSLFSGLRVLELASVLAAPAVGMFFAELGATVVKVENARTGGDVTRSWKSSREAANAAVSAYYASVNWGKETHLLDLSLPQLISPIDIAPARQSPLIAATVLFVKI